MNVLLSELLSHSDPSQVSNLSRFFKTGSGQYGEGDRFLGIKVPVTRSIVKSCWKEIGFAELEECIKSEYHEVRLAALLALVQIFTHSKKDAAKQKRCIDFYLGNTEYINNWDLVDLSCYEILGRWLFDKDRTLLYELASGGRNIWEQRIGIVSTLYFMRKGETDDTYAIAEIFLKKPERLHDLLQKACGWMLREAGKHNQEKLRHWIEVHISEMPRTMLRYAVEKFPEDERKAILSKGCAKRR